MNPHCEVFSFKSWWTMAEDNSTHTEPDSKGFVFKTNSHVVVIVILIVIFATIFGCLGGKSFMDMRVFSNVKHKEISDRFPHLSFCQTLIMMLSNDKQQLI